MLVQRLSQVEGVAEVNVSGAEQPAIRIRANPTLLASLGVDTTKIRMFSAASANQRFAEVRIAHLRRVQIAIRQIRAVELRLLEVALAQLRAGTLPPRAVVVIFDDGYADNFQVALPVLQHYRLPAAFFVAAGFLDGGCMFNDLVVEACRVAPAGG